jgi:rhodanese-related sulfurtransferase
MNNIIIIGIALLCFSEKTFAEDINAQGPYCGIYAVYSAKIILSGDANLVDLYKPEYISSRKGSSINDLKKAALDNGLYIKSIKNLSIEDISKTLPNLTILHVKPNLQSKDYDHYVLFLGVQDGKAQIFNPPNRMSLESFAEIEARWDGVGMIVSNEPIDLRNVLWPSRVRYCLICASVVGFVIAIRKLRNAIFRIKITVRNLVGLHFIQIAGLITVFVFISFVYHFSYPSGFLVYPEAVSSIQNAYAGSFIPKVTMGKMQTIVARNNAVIIDARYAKDYKSGHLEGAISVPINANDTQRQQAMAGIAKDSRIVVYCQSAGCSFAEKVTTKLKADSFSNISIYKGGWNDWQAKNN